jgi:transposase-like protein
MEKRRKFDRSFKLSAVKLLAASGESVSQVARSLGIHENLLRRWRNQLGDGTDIKMNESGRQERSEILRLRRRCRDLEQELAVLKKTLGLSVPRRRRDTK